ncbi:MAG: hypothetical protein A3G87_08570 [Omnitrophica bacterium RIFCSPLOWO2_12_FULL_50_11]|nr:MAG: hypothetical protein A3G87_08570 [Omnitrophica bacterium RIFCSPLOWO2_12_FULL_50_11]
MERNFQFEILTPDKTFYEGTISSLVAPGVEGFFGVLAHHAPLIGRSSGGKVKIREASRLVPHHFRNDVSDKAVQTTDIKSGGGLERFFQVGPGVVEVFKNRVVFLTKNAAEIEGNKAQPE